MKKLLSILAILTGICFSAYPQSSSVAASAFIKVDKMPEYPGGMAALSKVMTDGVEVPEPSVKWQEANEDVLKIVLTFMIDENGNVSDVQVVKSMSKDLDPKYVALVKKLKFKPAMQGGKPVKVKYTLPFEVDFGERNKY